jgi:hypothetical protein
LWRKDERAPEETEELENYRVLIDYGIYKPGEVDKHRGKLKKLREELAEVTSETEELKAERKTAADNYRYYLEQMQGDLGMILKRKRAEQKERQKDHRDIAEIERTQEEPQEYRDSRRRSTEAR